MPNFGKLSHLRLEGCDPKLQLILNEAKKHFDFTILCCQRGKKEQNRLYKVGKSKLQYPFSKHNSKPSLAVDLAPYFKEAPHIRWTDKEGFIYLAGLIKGIAHWHNVSIRWGGNWDMDNDLTDESFRDLGHFEIV